MITMTTVLTPLTPTPVRLSVLTTALVKPQPTTVPTLPGVSNCVPAGERGRQTGLTPGLISAALGSRMRPMSL